MERYLRLDVIEDDSDPVKFWQAASANFPHLGTVANRVFAAPATSALVERLFNYGFCCCRFNLTFIQECL